MNETKIGLVKNVEYEYTLSDKELREASVELAELQKQEDEYRAEKREALASFKEKLNGLNCRRQELSAEVVTGVREKEEDLILYLDYDSQERIYKDRSGVIKHKEPFLPGDEQRKLEID